MRSKIVTKRNTIMKILVHFLASSLKNKYKLNMKKGGGAGGGTDLLSLNVIIFCHFGIFYFPPLFLFHSHNYTIHTVFFLLNNRSLLSHSLGGYKFEI